MPLFLAPAEGCLEPLAPMGGLWPPLWPPAPSQDLKYVQTCGKYSLDSIDTFVFEIGHNLAKNWVCACKNIVCMHASFVLGSNYVSLVLKIL